MPKRHALWLNACFLALCCPAISGCTVIKVEGGSARIVPGMVQIKTDTAADLTTIVRHSYGITVNETGLTIGYKSEKIIFVPNNSTCTVIVFAANLTAESRIFFEELANRDKKICIQ